VNLSSLSQAISPDRLAKIHYYYKYLLDFLKTNNFGKEGDLRATRLFIGYSTFYIEEYFKSKQTNKEKIQWLKEATNYPDWKKIISSYPYKKMPWKQAMKIHLLYRRYFHLWCYFRVINQSISKIFKK